MSSLTTIRRQIKQAAAQRNLEQSTEHTIAAADHYTANDRATADNLEAVDMLVAFLAEEI